MHDHIGLECYRHTVVSTRQGECLVLGIGAVALGSSDMIYCRIPRRTILSDRHVIKPMPNVEKEKRLLIDSSEKSLDLAHSGIGRGQFEARMRA